MKKIFLSSTFVLAFAAYAIYTALTGQTQAPQVSDNTNPTPNDSNGTTNKTNTVSKTTTATSQTSATAKTYKYNDGDYTGDSADAYFGNVQVKVSIKNHLISDVQFLDYPQDRSTSLYKSNMAMPILKSEAIKSQSANVDTVSGATETSKAFIESLQSALTLAQN